MATTKGERREVRLRFEVDESGILEETRGSVATRIAVAYGFDPDSVELYEAYATVVGGVRIFESVTFAVCGVFYRTDFSSIERAESFDAKAGGDDGDR